MTTKDKLGQPMDTNQMTVARLIEVLQTLPQTALVQTLYADHDLSPVHQAVVGRDGSVWISDGWIVG